MKLRAFAAILAVLLSVVRLPLPAAYALEEPGENTTVLFAEFWSAPALLFMELNGDVSELTMPDDVLFYYKLQPDDVKNSSGNADGVTWRFEDFNSASLGLQNLTGEVILPDGYAYYDENGNEADLLIELPVLVLEAGHNKPIYSAKIAQTPELLFLELGGDASALNMPENVFCYYGPGYKDWALAPGVDWEFDELDTAAPGRQSVKGSVQPPEGYAYYGSDGHEAELFVEQPVLVYNPEATPTEEVIIWNPPLNTGPARLLPLGCSEEEADALLRERCEDYPEFLISTADGYKNWLGFSWDISKIDLTTQGAYDPWKLNMPSCLKLADGERDDLPVYVVDPGNVDLTATYAEGGGNYPLVSHWLYEAQELSLWYTARVPDDGSEPLWLPYEHVIFNETDMQIDLCHGDVPYLDGEEYWFQVRHSEGESNFLYVNMRELAVVVVPYVGDRSGGDRKPGGSTEIPGLPGNPPPAGGAVTLPPLQESPSPAPESPGTEPDDDSEPETPVTPPPSAEIPVIPPLTFRPESAGASSLSSVSESSASHPKAMAFTSGELETLLDIHGGLVPFSSSAGTAWIPESTLASHPLGADEVFSVLLHAPEPGQVEFRLWAGGKELTGPFDEAFTLSIPWKDGEAACTDKRGASVPCRLDADIGQLTLTAYETGVFKLTPLSVTVAPDDGNANTPAELAAEAARDQTASSVWPLTITGVLGVSGAGTAFVLRRGAHKARGRGKRP